MKMKSVFKCILAAALMSVLAAGTCFAAEDLSSQKGFPFSITLGQDAYDKICYAGHVTGGGIFYDDGYMVTPNVTFAVKPKYGTDVEVLSNLSVEIDLIYENSDNTSCVREIVRKYDFGDVKNGKEYALLTDTAMKSLKQRKKLYSSDVMSMKLVLSYKTDSGSIKKQAFLLYLAKDNEYNDKRNVLAAPPETE